MPGKLDGVGGSASAQTNCLESSKEFGQGIRPSLSKTVLCDCERKPRPGGSSFTSKRVDLPGIPGNKRNALFAKFQESLDELSQFVRQVD
jgi:hypothetical protein